MNTVRTQDPVYEDFADTTFSLMAVVGMAISLDDILDIASTKALKSHAAEAVAQARAAMLEKLQGWARS